LLFPVPTCSATIGATIEENWEMSVFGCGGGEMQNNLLRDRIGPFAVALIVCAAANSLIIGYSAEAAEFGKSCDVVQGFQHRKGNQRTVGYVTRLEIAGKKLSPDFTVTIPTKKRKTEVVGVVDSFSWRGGFRDPLNFSMHVSAANKKAVAALLHSTMRVASVEIEFAIYNYDPDAKKYFRSVHSDNVTIGGDVQRRGREYSIDIDMDASKEIKKPKNYRLTLGIMPSNKKQIIHLAMSSQSKFVKTWGISVAN
jgi:hypothetical protein